jgi:hypothetical protein
VLDLSSIDLEEIANALADQTDYEHHWLINPDTGEIAFWTADTGIDGQAPVDLDELDLVVIDPLPSWVWYQDMADFTDGITDERAGRRLARSIQGKGAFRRFKDELHEEYPGLLPAWYAFRDTRARSTLSTRRDVRLAERLYSVSSEPGMGEEGTPTPRHKGHPPHKPVTKHGRSVHAPWTRAERVPHRGPPGVARRATLRATPQALLLDVKQALVDEFVDAEGA